MEPNQRRDLLDRRGVLKVTGAAALAAALAELLPGSYLLQAALGQDADANAVVNLGSVPVGSGYPIVKEKIRAALEASLSPGTLKQTITPGGLVVIKVVSNSPYPYPMVTHPWALQAVTEIAKELGARVRVVDQVGFEHDFKFSDSTFGKDVQALWKKLAPTPFISNYQQVGSGMEALERNGLKAVAVNAGAEVYSGDAETDYMQVPNGDAAYGKPGDPEFTHWTAWKDIEGVQHPEGYRVNKRALGFDPTKGAFEAPCLSVSISRISAHIWAGHTGPLKAWYGWIHPQDRVRSHTDIDLVSESPVQVFGKLVTLPHPEVRFQAERIAEVAAFFQKHIPLLVNLVVNLDTYSPVGPDWGNVPIPALPGGKQGDGVIIASKDGTAADAVASSLLGAWIHDTPESQRIAPEEKELLNLKDLLNTDPASRDKYENALQGVMYSKTRGLWNTFFGSVPFLEMIDKASDGSVWTLGQIQTAHALLPSGPATIHALDPQASLPPTAARLFAGEPESPGFLKKIDPSKGGQ
jgi:hypothetical protein